MNNERNTGAAMQAVPPEAQLMQLIGSCFVSQAVYVAAKLGIADLIAAGTTSAADLAAKTGMHERSLYRVMRTLASFGVFSETEPKVFVNTPVSATLRSDVLGSLRDVTIWMGEEPHWRVYGHMLYSVETGKPAWDHVHGEPVFPYLFETNKDLGEIFNRAMTSFSHATTIAVNEAYDFSEIKTLADIAGGYGHVLAGIMKNYPEMRGVLFDLPAVLPGAEKMLEAEGVRDRVEIAHGDFFSSVPVKADAYLLKHIIHDWDDDKCVTILKNIGEVIRDDGRVLIIEMVVPEGNEAHFSKILDMEMLLSPGGIERTAEEFRELYEAAGFRLNRIVPTKSPYSIIEGVKA